MIPCRKVALSGGMKQMSFSQEFSYFSLENLITVQNSRMPCRLANTLRALHLIIMLLSSSVPKA